MLTADFYYTLPPERIAQTPVEPRDSSRLLVIHRDTGELEHRTFRDVLDYLQPGDLLVANDSRVLPGRLWARKSTGGLVELLLLRPLETPDEWEALAKPANRLRPGMRLTLVPAPDEALPASGASSSPAQGVVAAGGTSGQSGVRAGEGGAEGAVGSSGNGTIEVEGTDYVEIGERTGTGGLRVRFDAPVEEILARHGHVPLPPYIHARLDDPERYQTVYSRVTGSAAAPTAGLHFTPELLDTLTQRGIHFAFVTLHVGPDTFRPVKADNILDHVMHSEFAVVPPETARAIAETRRAGHRVIAVGTTAVRTLESWAASKSSTSPQSPAAGPETDPAAFAAGPQNTEGWSTWTRLFIYPGYTFRVVDALITNFHLPKSTLLMLISAFASPELVKRAYAEAIAHEYRFFSFGDASLFL